MRTYQYPDTPVFVKTWCEDIDLNTEAQIHHLAHLPFAFHHVAIMPDAHMGYGMPIGGVLATQGVVIPNAVGVDIGCGMRAARLYGMHEQDFTPDLRVRLREAILTRIPVGFHHHGHMQDDLLMPDLDPSKCDIVQSEYIPARTQLGTLGGGNHFIEIQADVHGQLWAMLHSGSRNLGKKVCDHYNRLAKEENARWHTIVPADWDLAFLPVESAVGQKYIREMNWCVEFARKSRALMMQRIGEIAYEVLGLEMPGEAWQIDVCHNYARPEHHYDRDVVVHRKGACFAGVDSIGIIPGSQGSKSYIVRGLGREDSFKSSSHGAGRAMGRKAATKTLDLAAETKILEDQGIVHGMKSAANLEEATGAYKNIEDVMAAQADLVEVTTELHPLVVVKAEREER